MSLFKISLLNSIQLFLLVFICTIHSQQANTVHDSLSAKSSEYLIEALKKADLNQEHLYKRALESKDLSQEAIIKIYIEVSNVYYKSEQYDRCIYYLNEAEVISKKIKDKEQLCRIYLKVGHVYLKEWKNQKALDQYYKALEIAQELKRLDLDIITKSSISIIRRRMNQLDKALEVSINALDLIDKTSYYGKSNHVNLITIISDIYIELTQFDLAENYVDKGLTISKSIDYKQGLVDLYIKKGIINEHRAMYKNAEFYLNSADTILSVNNIQNKLFKRNIDYYLAKSFFEQEKYHDAIEKLNNIITTVSSEELTKDRIVESHLLLANAYEGLGDQEQAVHWLNKHIDLNKKAQEAKDNTINEIYEKDTKLLDESISTLKQYSNYIKVSLLFIFLILVLVLIRGYRRKKTSKLIFNDLISKINKLESQDVKHKKASTHQKEIVIDDKKVGEVLLRLNKLENQDYFLSLDCNLRNMAKKVKTNATYLSKIINSEKGKNFNDYINDLRIDYVLKRLKSDKQFRLFSIKSIATEIGYKSDYSFAKHFKIKTGLNPSYYIKQLQALNDK